MSCSTAGGAAIALELLIAKAVAAEAVCRKLRRFWWGLVFFIISAFYGFSDCRVASVLEITSIRLNKDFCICFRGLLNGTIR